MVKSKLYPDVPPTKLRNKDEEFLTGANRPFWVWLADRFLFTMPERRFYAMRVKGIENFEKRNKKYGNISYGPHSCWWDGCIGYNILRRIFKTSLRMMIEEMNRFPIMANAGAFAVNKKSAQSAMKALQYSVDVLKDPNVTLWLFPQGIIRPPNYRPIEFQTGTTYIAQKCAKKYGGVNLIPCAISYTFLREDQPEVLINIGEPIIIETDKDDRKTLTEKLEKNLESLCDKQLENIRTGALDDYEVIFQTPLPWYRNLEHWLKSLGMPKELGIRN